MRVHIYPPSINGRMRFRTGLDSVVLGRVEVNALLGLVEWSVAVSGTDGLVLPARRRGFDEAVIATPFCRVRGRDAGDVAADSSSDLRPEQRRLS